jgi:hypothetical protein
VGSDRQHCAAPQAPGAGVKQIRLDFYRRLAFARTHADLADLRAAFLARKRLTPQLRDEFDSALGAVRPIMRREPC